VIVALLLSAAGSPDFAEAVGVAAERVTEEKLTLAESASPVGAA
jgi:hypothetical protein